MSMDQFFAMGGYAAYVWPSYGVSFVGIVGAVVWTAMSWRKARSQLALLEAMKDQKH
jgi:heme exporter protein D